MESRGHVPAEAMREFEADQGPVSDLREDGKQMQAVAERVGVLQKFRESRWVKRLALLAGILAGGEGLAANIAAAERGEKLDSVKTEIQESIAEAKESVLFIDNYVRGNPDQKFQARYLGKLSDEFRKQIGNVEVTVNDYFTMVVKVDTSETGEINTKYAFDKGSDGSVESMVMVPGVLSKDDRALAVLDVDAEPKTLETEVGMADMKFEDERGTPFNNRNVFIVNPDAPVGQSVFGGSFQNGDAGYIDDDNAVTLQQWWEGTMHTVRANIETTEKEK